VAAKFRFGGLFAFYGRARDLKHVRQRGIALNFVQAIQSGFSNYATFSGRAARSEFWYWTLFSFVVQIAVLLVDAELTEGIAGTLVSLALLLPTIAVGVRRLHDIDRTGWWWLISFTGIGVILLIVWACFKGTAGPNRFGPDPLQGVA
jgi:uncharacterized membrane protein YhaH (DUF805 family)